MCHRRPSGSSVSFLVSDNQAPFAPAPNGLIRPPAAVLPPLGHRHGGGSLSTCCWECSSAGKGAETLFPELLCCTFEFVCVVICRCILHNCFLLFYASSRVFFATRLANHPLSSSFSSHGRVAHRPFSILGSRDGSSAYLAPSFSCQDQLNGVQRPQQWLPCLQPLSKSPIRGGEKKPTQK